jgi:hypothetical protein
VTVITGHTFSDVRLYRPGQSTKPQRTWDTTATVTFDVPDEVVLLELRQTGRAVPPELPIATPSPAG